LKTFLFLFRKKKIQKSAHFVTHFERAPSLLLSMTTQNASFYRDDDFDEKKKNDFVPASSSSSGATAVFFKQSSKEYQSIKDARRALNVISLNAKEDMESIERQTYEQISELARDALRKKKEKKMSSSSSFLLSSLRVGEGTPPKGEREEREGERAFSLAYLEAREERSPPGQTKMDDTFDDENSNDDDDFNKKKRSSFDFGFNDDDAERSTNELPKAFKVPMTVPRGAFRRRDDEYYYGGEDETFASSSSEDEKEFEFNQSMVEETHLSSSVAAEAEENGNVGEREDWWFNVSTPAPAISIAKEKEKKTEELTPEQVLDRFDFTENKEAPFNSSAAAKSSISASPLYASPAYSFEKQFEDTLRFLGAMDLRTFKEQLLESKIDAVITEASASTLSNLTNGTPGSRADAWRTRVDEACEMLENAGAEAASEALMAKARALAAAVLKRR
jgi:hypothetical protein